MKANSVSFGAVDRREQNACFVSYSAIFEESIPFFDIVQTLKLLISDIPFIKYDKVQSQDWHLKWKSEIKPLFFDFGLIICPTWWKISSPVNVIIKMDSEQAFGTGSHKTTQLCLASIFELEEKGTILDFGCGTGVLGMAAYFVGFDKVYAIDEDPVAVEIASKNFRVNEIPAENICISALLDFESVYFDVIVANISLNTLLEFHTKFTKWIKPGGTLLLSGILNSQEESLICGFETSFSTISKKRSDEWSLLTLKRN